MSQTYTSTGAITVPTSLPRDEGGTLTVGRAENGINGAAAGFSAIGATELDYATAIRTDAQLAAEIQDFVALWCRATTSGLSSGSATLPYASATPREVLLRMKLLIENMLVTPRVYG